MQPDDIVKAAVISDCGTYRYRLSRVWGDGCLLPFCMLNPSTADASEDDPTIRRCISFARREGFAGIEVVNLFAYRATSPKAMFAAAFSFGPDNYSHLRAVAEAAKEYGAPIVCAWGTNASGREAIDIFRSVGAEMRCLGKTKDGRPRHPLYVKGDQPLEAYP